MGTAGRVTPAQAALLDEIEALAIDPPGARLTFVGRLAQENDWDPAYAAAVLQEYRRFLFLAATEAQPMTPSDAVDQAWHLHLAYSRSYWDDLCAGLLGRPLHHGPTAGGGQERTRYRQQYAATLAAYRAVFGAQPPDEIWPAVDQRFAGRFVRVDRAAFWLVRKRVAWVGAAAAGVTLIVVEGESFLRIATPVFVVAALGMFAIDKVRGKSKRRSSRGGDGGGGGGCGGD